MSQRHRCDSASDAASTFKYPDRDASRKKIGQHTPTARRCEERRNGASIRPFGWTPPASSRPSISISPSESYSAVGRHRGVRRCIAETDQRVTRRADCSGQPLDQPCVSFSSIFNNR